MQDEFMTAMMAEIQQLKLQWQQSNARQNPEQEILANLMSEVQQLKSQINFPRPSQDPIQVTGKARIKMEKEKATTTYPTGGCC